MEPDDPDPTRRFTDRAGAYARSRPSYPPAAVDAVLAGLGPPADLVAADVGAGTGISSRLLAGRGLRVFAVEPNAAMRDAAVPHPGVTWCEGTSEAPGLADACCDLVLVAQAFHWFVVAPTLREFQRILRVPGRLAIVWNRRERRDPFTLGYCAALEAIDGEAPAERSVFDPAVVAATGRFRNPRCLAFPNAQALTLDALVTRALSTSTVPRSGPQHDELMRLLAALHARHRDERSLATMHYRTDVHLWDRTP